MAQTAEVLPRNRTKDTQGLVTLDVEGFVNIFNSEVTKLEKIDSSLTTMEEILLDPEYFQKLSKGRQMAFYQLILQRKDLAQKFLTKMMELGIKTDILNKLMAQNISQSSDAPANARPSRKVRTAANYLRDLMNAKTAGHTD